MNCRFSANPRIVAGDFVGFTVELIQEVRRLALSDVRTLCDLHGALRGIHTLTKAQAAPIASFEVLMKNAAGGNGGIDRVIKIRLWDKMKALELAAKILHLLVARVEHTGRYGGPMTVEAVPKLSDEELEQRLLAYAQKVLPAAASG
jgi:hypothetical protein